MKIRSGFVSNSSSSSFLLYGVVFESDAELLKSLGVSEQEAEEKYLDASGDKIIYEVLGKERFKELVQNNQVSIRNPTNDNLYVGVSWDKVRDDETGSQFKERVQKIIDGIFKDKQKCSTQEESWYDG